MNHSNIYREFIHPEDEAARRQLEAIPGFPALIKAFMAIGFERMFQGINMATKLKISATQMPELYAKLARTCRKLQIDIPEFYLEMNPFPNAYTYGDTKIFITITSGLLEYLDDDEVESVIAHECGHIVCRHVLYKTVASILFKGFSDFSINLGGIVLVPIKLAFRYWDRRAELSADRCAASVCNSANPVIETMLRLAAGPKSITEKINLKEFVQQGSMYDDLLESKWDKILQASQIMYLDHPFPAVRVNEIIIWSKTEQFKRLSTFINSSKGEFCPSCLRRIKTNWQFCKHCGMKLK